MLEDHNAIPKKVDRRATQKGLKYLTIHHNICITGAAGEGKRQ